MPSLRTEGDWAKAASILRSLEPRVSKALQSAFLAEAEFFRKKILEEFKRGGPEGGGTWAPLSPMTLAVRALLGNKKTKLLQQSGDLRNSISVIPVEGVGVFVGVSRTASSKSRLGAVNLAMLHEEGASFTVRMTPKQRQLLAIAAERAGLRREKVQRLKGAPGVSSEAVEVKITIPARPFLGPVFTRYGQPDDIANSILNRVARSLDGDLGKPDGEPRS